MSKPQAAGNITDAASLRAAREVAYEEFRKTQSVGKLTKQLTKMSDQILAHLWSNSGLKNEAALDSSISNTS